MSTNLQQELNETYNRLLALSGQVEEMIEHAVQALMGREFEAAAKVIEMDSEIDQAEVKIEETCLTILARHQPVAADLRKLATMMKVNNDLERVADLACNVAERACDLVQFPSFPFPSVLSDMATNSREMVQSSLDALIKMDPEIARKVIERDDEVDEMNVQLISEVETLMKQDTDWVEPGLFTFSASRSVEQIADHAVNMAEDIIYMVSGVIVRHRHGEPQLRSR